MRLQITLLLFVASAFANVWEFGKDNINSILVLQYQGRVSFFEKTKNIKLEVPECYEIDYVKVKVNNMVSTPTVHYDNFNKEVTISYKPLEISLSSYEIDAKAEILPYCVKDTNQQQT